MFRILKRLHFLLVSCSYLCSLSLYAQGTIKADSKLCTYNSRYTQSVSDSLQGCMNPGDEMTVNEYSPETKTAHVTATTGVSEGQSGWTSSESISNSLQGQVNGETPSSTQALPNAMDRAILDAIASGNAKEATLESGNFTPRTDEEIWEGTRGENPRYKIDLDRYDGGDYIPFNQDSYDSAGTRTRTTHYVRANSDSALRGIARLSETNQQLLNSRQSSYCQSGIHQTYSGNESGWIPSCEVLQNENFTPAHKAQLSQCVMNMKAAINEGGSSHGNLLRNLYRKLNTREQEFAAMIFTSIGEASITNHADRVMIMKTINNRVRDTQERGRPQVNELDIVLQPWQFSMYNEEVGANWRKALANGGMSSSNYTDVVSKSIDSYLMYRNTDFSDDSSANRIYHYLMPSHISRTNWVEHDKQVSPQVGNEGPSHHKFYTDIAWSFAGNQYRS